MSRSGLALGNGTLNWMLKRGSAGWSYNYDLAPIAKSYWFIMVLHQHHRINDIQLRSWRIDFQDV